MGVGDHDEVGSDWWCHGDKGDVSRNHSAGDDHGDVGGEYDVVGGDHVGGDHRGDEGDHSDVGCHGNVGNHGEIGDYSDRK